jgi:hypothetical protein
VADAAADEALADFLAKSWAIRYIQSMTVAANDLPRARDTKVS